MDLTNVLSQLKKKPGFVDKVGMVLIHNGVVRGVSRDGKPVKKLRVVSDFIKIEEIRSEYEKQEGIFKILVEAKSGEFFPGEDLLWIVVAGDVRENVKRVLSEVLDRVKSEAVKKEEILL